MYNTLVLLAHLLLLMYTSLSSNVCGGCSSTQSLSSQITHASVSAPGAAVLSSIFGLSLNHYVYVLCKVQVNKNVTHNLFVRDHKFKWSKSIVNIIFKIY